MNRIILLCFLLLSSLSSTSFALSSASAPTKLQIPFANSAGGAYIRTIPVGSQIGIQNGAASYTDGFPPLNFTPVNAGGVPPFGQDMNGVLNSTSAIDRWVSAGGAILPYDSAYQTLIGGYPNGACVMSLSTVARIWCSTTDNNVTNPDSAGAGWQYPNNAVNATNQSGGTVSATTISASGQITSTVATGTMPLIISSTTEVTNLHAATATTSGSATNAVNVTGSSQPSITTVGTLTGLVVSGAVISRSNTSTVAGGDSTGVLRFGIGNIGIYFGSGAPTISANQGSLYIRTDGSATNNRMYINTNGATTWTAVTTAL